MGEVVTFTLIRSWPAEGARVGIATCELCGAAILIDPNDSEDFKQRHREWHLSVAEPEGER